jgi:SAM-dependent methyltransferase
VDVEEFVVLHLPQAPSRILEMGCGTGELALALAKRGHDLTAIDPGGPERLGLSQGFASRRSRFWAATNDRTIAHEGGAYNRVAADATAFVHRDELFQLKHAVIVDPQGSTGEKEAAHRWVARSWATVHPWGSGRVFQNFADLDLSSGRGAYGTNYNRLVTIKARYDPVNFFRFH